MVLPARFSHHPSLFLLRIARDHGDEASPFVAWQELGTSAEISPGLISCFCWNKEIEMCTCTRVYSRSYSRSLMVSTMAIDCRYCTSFRDPGTTPRHNCWSAFSRHQICAGTLFSSPPLHHRFCSARALPHPRNFCFAAGGDASEEKTPIGAGFVNEERGAGRALEKKIQRHLARPFPFRPAHAAPDAAPATTLARGRGQVVPVPECHRVCKL